MVNFMYTGSKLQCVKKGWIMGNWESFYILCNEWLVGKRNGAVVANCWDDTETSGMLLLLDHGFLLSSSFLFYVFNLPNKQKTQLCYSWSRARPVQNPAMMPRVLFVYSRLRAYRTEQKIVGTPQTIPGDSACKVRSIIIVLIYEFHWQQTQLGRRAFTTQCPY